MDRIAQYLQTDPPSLASALARFCQLARAHLGAWELSADKLSIETCISRLRDNQVPTSLELLESPRAWLKAIDQELYETSAPGAWRADTAVFDGDEQHWIIRRTSSGSGFNTRLGALGHYLTNHHVVPAHVGGTPTKAVSVPQATATACKSALEHGAFKIAVVRFDDYVKETLACFDAVHHFRMTGVDRPDSRLASILGALNAARDANVDCIVFPELTTTPEIARRIAEHLLDEAVENSRRLPPLIVLGSYHEPTQGPDQPHTRNRAILLAHDGAQLMHFDKRRKVLFKFEPDGPDWGEALSPCDTPYQLLPLEIGLLGLAICKDLFDGPISELLRAIDLDWLLVPSMSNKLNQHQTKTKQLHNQSGTVSVIANQIMPGSNGDGDYPFGYIQQGADPQPCPNPIEIVDIPLRTEEMAAGRNHLRLVR